MWNNYDEKKPPQKGYYLVYIPNNPISIRARLAHYTGVGFVVSGVRLWAYSPGTSGDYKEVKAGDIGQNTALFNAGLSTRVYNAICTFMQRKMNIGWNRANAMTLSEVAALITEKELLVIRNMGKKSVDELKETFSNAGLKLN